MSKPSVRKVLVLLQREARRGWGISGRIAIALFAAPLVVLPAAAVIRLADRSLLLSLTREDGLLEWTQVLLSAIGLILSVMIATHFARRSRPLPALLYSILAIGLFFVVGEELAWGQRVLGLETPERLLTINSKGELSLHNVSTLEPWCNVAKLVTGIYGAFGFVVLRWVGRRMNVATLELFVVPFFLSSAFFVMFAQRFLRLTLMSHWCPVDFGEYEELCVAYGLAAFTVLVLCRLRAGKTGFAHRRW